jgi:hypothetical protein
MSKACELRSANRLQTRRRPQLAYQARQRHVHGRDVDFDDLGGQAEREEDQPLVPWGVRSRRLVGLAVMLRDPTIKRLRI